MSKLHQMMALFSKLTWYLGNLQTLHICVDTSFPFNHICKFKYETHWKLIGVFCRCAFKSKNYVGRLDKCYKKPIQGVFAAGDPGLQGQAFSQQLHELGVTSHDAIGLCLQDQGEIERTKPVGFLIIGMQGMRRLENFAWAQLHARYKHT
jgi:hypothetical protein